MTSRLRRLATVAWPAASMGFGMALVAAGPGARGGSHRHRHQRDDDEVLRGELPAGLRTGRRGLRVHRALQPRRRRHRHLGLGLHGGHLPRPGQQPAQRGRHRARLPRRHGHPLAPVLRRPSNSAVFNTVSGQTADFSFAPSGLSSSGENVTLVDAAGATVESLTYAAASPWPSLPNGLGPSLELTDPFANPTVGGNWGVSATSVGTPARAELVLRPAAAEHRQRGRDPVPAHPRPMT